MAVVVGGLVAANLLVILAAVTHQRNLATRILSHFARAVMMLRFNDGNCARPSSKRSR
jgi:hypothetical protein